MRYWLLCTQLLFLLYVNQFVIDRSRALNGTSLWLWFHQLSSILQATSGLTLLLNQHQLLLQEHLLTVDIFQKPNNITRFISIAWLRLQKPKWLVLLRHKLLWGRLAAESAGGPLEESIQSCSYLIMRAADPWAHGFILPQQWLTNKLCWVPLIDLKPFEVAVKRQS